jgi:hypothetical protein
MKIASRVIELNYAMSLVIHHFKQTHLIEIPLDNAGRFAGMISKIDLVAGYRNKLIKTIKSTYIK